MAALSAKASNSFSTSARVSASDVMSRPSKFKFKSAAVISGRLFGDNPTAPI